MKPVRRLTVDDLPRLRQFGGEHWGEVVVSRGRIYRPEQLEGFVIEEDHEWIGLITFFIEDPDCEVTSFNSLREGQGIGTILIHKAIAEAREGNCRRIFLITTNDNLKALGFYQKRGFELVRIYRGAMHQSRKIKPSIPMVGRNSIPLRDEIELERIL